MVSLKSFQFRKAHVQPGWRIAADAFSLQASSDQDPKFWIRLEMGGSGPLRVTDFSPSQLGIEAAAEALAALVAETGREPIRFGMVFTDIAPGKGAGEAEPRAQEIAVALVPFAERMGVRVESLCLACEQGKHALQVSLTRLDQDR